jgi:cation:H+ antiporter
MDYLDQMAFLALTGKGLGLPATVFVLLGGLVFIAASRLAKHADAISDATGLGRVWIGSVLLAASTSLPELLTDVNAAAVGAVDIGVGDLFGSTLANMVVLAILDIVYARRRILHNVAFDHVLVAALAIVLTTLATAGIAANGFARLGPVGLETVLIVGLYLFGMHAVFRSIGVVASPPVQLTLGDTRRTVLLRGARGFALGTIALALTAPALVVTARAVALEAGQTETMVGTVLVGVTTSFPEIAATVAAVRAGAFDLAVGNIFGSSAINMCILFAMDVAYAGESVLAAAATTHVQTGLAAVLVLGLGTMGILARAQRRFGVLRVESLFIVAVYVAMLSVLIV